MLDHPDRYTMADRFLRGVPANWRTELFNRDFTPELNSIEELVAEAKAIEAAEHTARHYNTSSLPQAYTNTLNSQRDAQRVTTRDKEDNRRPFRTLNNWRPFNKTPL